MGAVVAAVAGAVGAAVAAVAGAVAAAVVEVGDEGRSITQPPPRQPTCAPAHVAHTNGAAGAVVPHVRAQRAALHVRAQHAALHKGNT